MKGLGISCLLIVLMLTSCKSKLTTAQLQERNAQLEQLAVRLDEYGYEIKMNAAYPLTTAALNNVANGILLQTGNSANRINLTDRHDYIKRKGDQVSADLSYFGERQIAAGYNTEAGIKFNDRTTNYSQIIDTENGNIEIQFTATDEHNENYPVRISLTAAQTASINITSSHRTNIRYTGTLRLLEATEEVE